MKVFISAFCLIFMLVACQRETDDTLPIATQTTISTLSRGLVANYTFSGNSLDSTLNSNHGTVTGASLTGDRYGNPNNAYLFNGINNYITINNSASLTIKDSFSIAAWIKPDNYLLPGVVVWNGDPAFAKDPFILYFSNRPGYNAVGVRKDVVDGTSINEVFAQSNLIFSGVWCHVVGTCNFSSKKMSIYVNGELINSASFADMSINYTTTNFRTIIGAAESSAGIDNFFKGKIDDVRIYNRELSANEVMELFKL